MCVEELRRWWKSGDLNIWTNHLFISTSHDPFFRCEFDPYDDLVWYQVLVFHFLKVAAPQFFSETYLSPELRDRFLYTYTFSYCKSIKWKCELVSEFWSMRFFHLLNCMLKNADGLIVARQCVRVYNGWKTWSDKRKNKRINKTKTTTTPTSTEDIPMRYYMSTVSTQRGMCISYWFKFILDKLPK